MKFYSEVLNTLDNNPDLTDCFLHIHDTFTPDYISDIIMKSGRPKVVLSDHMTLSDTLPSDIQGIFLPLVAQREAYLWRQQEFDNRFPDTRYTFCIMANKKTLNRSLCLRMVEILGFKNFTYTWSGLGRSTELSTVITELDSLGTQSPLTQDQRSALLAPIKMPAKIIGTTRLVEDVSLQYEGSRRDVWEQGLNKMFQGSAINLINETFVAAKEAVFTEKTVYSVLGLNFPIWVGGFGQAEMWRNFGFDTFDDIIDHGYQHRKTLVERCWYALHLNREILNNVKQARDLRKQHHDRLINNRNALLSGRLFKYCLEQINLMPVQYKQHARECARLICKM